MGGSWRDQINSLLIRFLFIINLLFATHSAEAIQAMHHFEHILYHFGFSEIEAINIIDAIDLAGCHIDDSNSSSELEYLEILNTSLQSCFKRDQKLERHQVEDKYDHLRKQLLPLLTAFSKEVDDGIDIPEKMLLGAAETTVKERFDILRTLEKKGHHSDTIYLLGGERDLWLDREATATIIIKERLMAKEKITEDEALNIIKQAIDKYFFNDSSCFELDDIHSNARKTCVDTDITKKREAVIEYFVNSKNIAWPTESDLLLRLADNYKEEFVGTKFILVDTPVNIDADGNKKRPDTKDTFIKFWQDHKDYIKLKAEFFPDHKFPMAIVSNQPFGPYQTNQAKSFFYDKPIKISAVVAPTKPSQLNISVTLDSLARAIYSGKDLVTQKIKY